MTNQVSSEAHFRARALEYGLPDQWVDLLNANGIKTMGNMAFAISRPGAEFDESQFNDWSRDLNNGQMPTMGIMSGLRRLRFESEIVLTATLRASVETPDTTTPI